MKFRNAKDNEIVINSFRIKLIDLTPYRHTRIYINEADYKYKMVITKE